MDISKMSDAEIMTLPDHAFGQRWIMGASHFFNDGAVHYVLSRAPLPEKIVVFNYWLYLTGETNHQVHNSIRLHDVVPATDTAFYAGELIFAQANRLGQSDFVHYANDRGPFKLSMRQLINTAGRRLCVRSLRTVGAATIIVGVYMEIASVPKSVPEWFH